MSPSGITAAPATAGGAGGCADDGVDELSEMVPMLDLYYDADEFLNDQRTHSYLTTSACFDLGASPIVSNAVVRCEIKIISKLLQPPVDVRRK